MFDDEGPDGWPLLHPEPPWKLTTFAFGVGYAVSIVGAPIALIFLLESLAVKTPGGMLAGPAGAWLLGVLPGFMCWFVPEFRRQWEEKLAAARIAAWHLLLVGVICGSLMGLGFAGLRFAPSSLFRSLCELAIFMGGPVPGVLWFLYKKPVPQDGDYDDSMLDRSSAVGQTIDLPNLAATEAFGRRLGALLFPNAVVALIGPLGAGKTQLSRAIAEGLGIANPAAVTSPTFTLIHEYPARLPIFHFDAYRLSGPNEFLDLGVTEYFEAGGVCLIEWADKVESALPAERLTIRVEVVDENRRRVEIAGAGARYQVLAVALANNEKAIDHG